MFRLALSLGLLAALCLPLPAQTIVAKATIPFDFQLGAQLMPAGDYYIFHSGRVLSLRSAGHAAVGAMALTAASPGEPSREPSKLVFRRYGNECFLAKVWISHSRTGVALPPARRERELIAAARRASPTHVVVAAK